MAVVDVETTGLHPGYHHRVIEVAVVKLEPDGRREGWSTLVNPERDLGPQGIHGVRGVDVREAPPFEEVAGDLAMRLNRRGVVAHNARFDQLFIESEMRRLGAEPPALEWHCTIAMSRALGWRAALQGCCRDAGTPTRPAHNALDDANACADVLIALLRHGVPEPVWHSATWPALPVSGRQCDRGAGASRPAPSPLALLSREAADDPEDPFPAYSVMLNEAMEDRLLTSDEAAALAALARALGLDEHARQRAHERWCGRILAHAQSDGQITERERADLSLVADALDVDLSAIAAVRTTPKGATLPPGVVVCFTGALECSLDGEPITRERAQALAEAAGLTTVKTVTRKCQLLVVADPHTQSAKARKARELGVRVIAESAFWPMVGVDVN
ncbi:MAG: polymerase subunit epsilon [Thermoleophilaceae bacterium]|nr:polymerase subunit epsilon [Thermoleophilaceae bacterium]